MMKVFAGTYQGNVFFLQGTPSTLRIKSVQPVSENSVRAMTLSEDELVVGGYDQQIRALNINSGVETKESKDSKGVINCIRTINNKDLALGLESGTIRFWDKTSWSSRRDIRQHKKAVTDIKMDKKGVMMVSVAGREMIFWNLSSFKSLYHFRYDFGFIVDIEHVLLVDSFEYLFLLSDKTVRQIGTQDNKELFTFSIEEKIQCGLVFQNYLLLATEKGQIKIWNHGHYEFCIHFKAHDLRIKDMKSVVIDDTDYLVTADSNGIIRVWDILQFLKGVDSISQDYNLEGLQPLSSIQTKQRVICIEVGCQKVSKQKKAQQKVEIIEKAEQEQQEPEKKKQSKKKNKNKLIEKQERKKSGKKKTN